VEEEDDKSKSSKPKPKKPGDALEDLLREMEDANALSPRSQLLAELQIEDLNNKPTKPAEPVKKERKNGKDESESKSPRSGDPQSKAHHVKPRVTPNSASPSRPSPPAAESRAKSSAVPQNSSSTLDFVEEILKQPHVQQQQQQQSYAPSVSAASVVSEQQQQQPEGEYMQTDEGIVFVPLGMELVMTPQGMMLIPQGQSGNLVQLADGSIVLQSSEQSMMMPSTTSGDTEMMMMGLMPMPGQMQMMGAPPQFPTKTTMSGYTSAPSPNGGLYGGGGGFGGSNVVFGMDPGLLRGGGTQQTTSPSSAASQRLTTGRTPASPATASSSKYDVDAVLESTRAAVVRSKSAKHPATGLGNNPVGSRLPASNKH
jgi:hypothetical protein